jgi:hypothetical protein
VSPDIFNCPPIGVPYRPVDDTCARLRAGKMIIDASIDVKSV